MFPYSASLVQLKCVKTKKKEFSLLCILFYQTILFVLCVEEKGSFSSLGFFLPKSTFEFDQLWQVCGVQSVEKMRMENFPTQPTPSVILMNLNWSRYSAFLLGNCLFFICVRFFFFYAVLLILNNSGFSLDVKIKDVI